MTRYLSGAVQEDVTLGTRHWTFFLDLAKEHGVAVRDVQAEVLRRFADLDPASRARFTAKPPVVRTRHSSPTGRTLHDHRAEVEAMLKDGMTDTAIGHKLGFSQSTVSRFRRVHIDPVQR